MNTADEIKRTESKLHNVEAKIAEINKLQPPESKELLPLLHDNVSKLHSLINSYKRIGVQQNRSNASSNFNMSELNRRLKLLNNAKQNAKISKNKLERYTPIGKNNTRKRGFFNTKSPFNNLRTKLKTTLTPTLNTLKSNASLRNSIEKISAASVNHEVNTQKKRNIMNNTRKISMKAVYNGINDNKVSNNRIANILKGAFV